MRRRSALIALLVLGVINTMALPAVAADHPTGPSSSALGAPGNDNGHAQAGLDGAPNSAAPSTPGDPSPVDPDPTDPGPATPATPDTPANPGNPGNPSTPGDPSPVDPDPTDPGPATPDTPDTPADPSPVDPDPTDPGPATPDTPANPGNPGNPSTPGDPSPVDPDPTDPGPATPDTPANPGNPSTPGDPSPVDPDPTDPGPATPDTPANPGNPSTPGDPSPVDPDPTDPGPVDPGPVDPGPIDPETLGGDGIEPARETSIDQIGRAELPAPDVVAPTRVGPPLGAGVPTPAPAERSPVDPDPTDRGPATPEKPAAPPHRHSATPSGPPTAAALPSANELLVVRAGLELTVTEASPITFRPSISALPVVAATSVSAAIRLSPLFMAHQSPQMAFTVTQQPDHGFVTLDASGQAVFQPEAGFVGLDSFAVRACHPETVTCQTAVIPVTVHGIVTNTFAPTAVALATRVAPEWSAAAGPNPWNRPASPFAIPLAILAITMSGAWAVSATNRPLLGLLNRINNR